jgi:hypothetical protein
MKSLTSTASNVAIAAGGLVGLAGLAGAQTVNGNIVSYSGLPVEALSATSQDLIFDLATDTVTTVTGTNDNKNNAQSFDLEARNSGTSNSNFLPDTESNGGGANTGVLVVGGNSANIAPDLAAGTVIGTQATTGNNSGTTAGTNYFFTGKNYAALNVAGNSTSQFPDTNSNPGSTVTTTGYLGFSFVDPGLATQVDYGWAQVTVDPSGDITLDGFAYDDSGATIAAGAIAPASPEPTTAGMVLLGGAALALLARRSRKESLTA